MDTTRAEVVREALSFGEDPRWHDGRLWYSDFYRHGVYSLDEAGEERLEHRVDAQPSGLGWLPNGDLVCVSMTDHRVLRFHDGEVSEFCDISAHCGFWANDMATSASGVSYVGNFGFDLHAMLRGGSVTGPFPTANVVVLSPSGEVLQVVPDLSFPNGTLITPDERTLIVAETTACRLSAFDVGEDGRLSNRRIWAAVDGVYPDGMCLDAEGQVWLANAVAAQCLRVKEGGEVTGAVQTSQVSFACALGAGDGRSLYVMTAPTSDPEGVSNALLGRVEVARVSVGAADHS
ncbi:MAG TPA: SMP-30/gluconolactonase/LRE family protein [Acidimicrobiales bacterium]